MKKITKFALVVATVTTMFFGIVSCNNGNTVTVDNDEVNNDTNVDATNTNDSTVNEFAGTIWEDFYNYPKGCEDPTGTLKIENLLTTESIIVFDGSVTAENYVGKIAAGSTIQVKLAEADKFHTLIGICESAYENSPEQATQVSARTYYSKTQSYIIQLSPSNLTGAGRWTFNNNTKYWVSIKALDNSQTYAVIQPSTKQVTVPVQLDVTYSYKIVYEEEIKLGDTVLAINPYTDSAQNDSFILTSGNTRRDTNLNGIESSTTSKSDPVVRIINTSGKGLFLYRGDVRLTAFSSVSDNYVLNNGENAFFTGFTKGASLSTIKAYSTAWNNSHSFEAGASTTMENGKVYVIEITGNSSATNGEPPTFTLKETVDLAELQE